MDDGSETRGWKLWTCSRFVLMALKRNGKTRRGALYKEGGNRGESNTLKESELHERKAQTIRVGWTGDDEGKPQDASAGDGGKREAGAANRITRYFVVMRKL